MTPEKCHQGKNIASAKGVWDYLEKIGEGVATQKYARIYTLRSKVHRFTRHEGENVAAIYNRLTALANELASLGATDVTNTMVVRTLLRSLDDSFSHIVLMIKERSDFKDLFLLMLLRDSKLMRWKKKKNMMSMDLEEELMHLKLVLHAILLRILVLPLVAIQMTLQVFERIWP